jgi:high-affinity nickel-transport protein
LLLGSLYALGHATVVIILGLLALSFGTVLPEWVDPIMARVVGITLLLLGIWVFVSLYQYARHGMPFRLRSRWMLVFDSVRYAWRRFQARLHGHEHVDPIEMSSYGPRTAFGVGMIHGIGAETGTQILLIAAIGGASGTGLGIPMLLAFVVGLLISNSIVVVITATGFIATRARERLYLAIGLVAGTFSLVVGAIFLFGLESHLPELDRIFGG